MEQKRDSTIDIAKAFGIVFVVLGHTQFKYSQLLYQFHLPLFFFLSGMVIKEEKLYNWKNFIITKTKGMYFSFIKFQICFLLFHNMFVNIGFYSELSGVKLDYDFKYMWIMFLKIITMGGGEQLLGPLWFLISCFEIIIIFAALYKFSRIYGKYSELFLIGTCLLLFYIGCYTHFPRMLSQSLIGLLFYAIGFEYKKNKSLVILSLPFSLLCGITLIICSMYNYVDIARLLITHKWMLIISGASGIYIILVIAKILASYNFKWLQYCGCNTLFILALHCFSFKIVMIIQYFIYGFDWKYIGLYPAYQVNAWWSIPLTFFGVVIPIFIKKMIDKVYIKIS